MKLDRCIWALSALLITSYMLCLTFRLESFPIYFFCDEAIHGYEAYSMVKTGHDSTNNFFPIYFKGFGDFQWSLSIYAQMPLIALLGLDIFTVRLTVVIFSFIALIGLVKLLISIGIKSAPIFVPLLLLLSPFWFIHSRTGFEVIIAMAFFIWHWVFIVQLLKDTPHKHRCVIAAALLAAATFYSYAPARGWIFLSLLLTTLVFIKTIWKNKWSALLFVLCFLILMAPYGYFHYSTPELAMKRLASLGIKSVDQIFTKEIIGRAWNNFMLALDPMFWFMTETAKDAYPERHSIPGYSDIPSYLLPFFALGVFALAQGIQKLSPLVLVFGLAGTFPAVLVGVNPLRCMPVGIMYISVIAIGIDFVLRHKIIHHVAARVIIFLLIFAPLIALAARMQKFVHSKAAAQYKDYEFYGIQYGAPQIYQWIAAHLDQYPTFLVSHDFFNGNEIFPLFFFSDDVTAQGKIKIVDLIGNCNAVVPIQKDTVILARWRFAEENSDHACDAPLHLVETIKAPNGKDIIGIWTTR